MVSYTIILSSINFNLKRSHERFLSWKAIKSFLMAFEKSISSRFVTGRFLKENSLAWPAESCLRKFLILLFSNESFFLIKSHFLYLVFFTGKNCSYFHCWIQIGHKSSMAKKSFLKNYSITQNLLSWQNRIALNN